ncbi:hypothetical protein CRV08_06980 [Halarcobacter ebronensis]|uniref:Uncharacterized protein n=1 Tax=Halarcobacter ebronensis TaxID=1462615 RepID=A0A4Q0YEM5_9BACT|nr:hypothetical protein [Halarcobacter ebronensis]RXJ68565.1 hypothetical protein CRV08_06980 [Halarcobacter ebronensis]
MEKIKVIDSKLIEHKNETYIYRLLTEVNEMILKISENDIEKGSLIKYIKCPFYLILNKSVDKTIGENDYFEVSTCESTIDLECKSTCQVNLR